FLSFPLPPAQAAAVGLQNPSRTQLRARAVSLQSSRRSTSPDLTMDTGLTLQAARWTNQVSVHIDSHLDYVRAVYFYHASLDPYGHRGPVHPNLELAKSDLHRGLDRSQSLHLRIMCLGLSARPQFQALLSGDTGFT
ncbi:hypothetical protein V8E36_005498, partial [Tilletia maclaganii]